MKLTPKKLTIIGLFVALLSPATAASIIGINFARDSGGAHTGTADGLTNWTDVFDGQGFAGDQNITLTDSNSNVTASWVASNSWWAGSNANSERRIYATYLDDGQSSGITALGGSLNDGIGVRVQLTGLSSWLSSEGMNSYRIRVYSSTDTANGLFQTVTVHQGNSTGSVLDTINVSVLGDDDYPDGPFDTTASPRGYGDSDEVLNADTITLTLPTRDGSNRATIAAIKIEAFNQVPEPSSALLVAVGAPLILLRRRSK